MRRAQGTDVRFSGAGRRMAGRRRAGLSSTRGRRSPSPPHVPTGRASRRAPRPIAKRPLCPGRGRVSGPAPAGRDHRAPRRRGPRRARYNLPVGVLITASPADSIQRGNLVWTSWESSMTPRGARWSSRSSWVPVATA